MNKRSFNSSLVAAVCSVMFVLLPSHRYKRLSAYGTSTTSIGAAVAISERWAPRATTWPSVVKLAVVSAV
jgi:hypothetical protein